MSFRKQRAEDYRGHRTAGIRLTEELVSNITPAPASPSLHSAVHRFDKAHLVMLVEEGLIPKDAGVSMLKVLRELEKGDIVAERTRAGGGTHSGEYILIRRLGEDIGGWIHLGRSSGDLGAVSSRIAWRDQLLAMIERINRYRTALLGTALEHLDTVMPGYTHGQSAQPTTYGHQLLAWELALARDVHRARDTYGRLNVSPAGAAIFTGSSFPLNRERTSELLGFDRPSFNTFDAILQHDDSLEIASVLAIHGYTMARAADDLIFWSAGEVGMISVPDRFCGSSSIMMQKKNMYAPEEIKGSYGAGIGCLVTTFVVEKGPTGMPILDRFYGEGAIERQFAYVHRNLDWMTELVPELVVRKDVMLEQAGAYWAQATDLGAALVEELSINWRSAHQIVGILVRLAEERGLSPYDVTPELLDEAAIEYMGEPVDLSDEVLHAALDCSRFVKRRTLYGGPAPDAVTERLPDYRDSLEHDQQWLKNQRQHHRRAEAKLETAVNSLIGQADG